MDTDKKQKLIDDLALALMYLTGWKEKDIAGEPYIRAWKGYDFNVLDRLMKKGKRLTREEFIKRIHEASERKTKSK